MKLQIHHNVDINEEDEEILHQQIEFDHSNDMHHFVDEESKNVSFIFYFFVT